MLRIYILQMTFIEQREDPDDRDKEDIVYRRDVCFSQVDNGHILIVKFLRSFAQRHVQPW